MHKRQDNENPSEENSANESKTETNNFSSAPISGSYGSTSVQDESVPRFYVPCCGLVFYIMAFFGFVSALQVRECLSVAIVAMVNHTAVSVVNVGEDQTLRDLELRYEGEEFNWDRNQQAIVLAAFYYGYGVTKVYIHSKPGSLRIEPCSSHIKALPLRLKLFQTMFKVFHDLSANCFTLD